jgi:hypothetical protein
MSWKTPPPCECGPTLPSGRSLKGPESEPNAVWHSAAIGRHGLPNLAPFSRRQVGTRPAWALGVDFHVEDLLNAEGNLCRSAYDGAPDHPKRRVRRLFDGLRYGARKWTAPFWIEALLENSVGLTGIQGKRECAHPPVQEAAPHPDGPTRGIATR